jgi:hypothetical protein
MSRRRRPDGRHHWAVIERRFNWLTGRSEYRCIGTRKTSIAAYDQASRAFLSQHVLVVPTAALDPEAFKDWTARPVLREVRQGWHKRRNAVVEVKPIPPHHMSRAARLRAGVQRKPPRPPARTIRRAKARGQ